MNERTHLYNEPLGVDHPDSAFSLDLAESRLTQRHDDQLGDTNRRLHHTQMSSIRHMGI